jgi:hypothetical protein
MRALIQGRDQEVVGRFGGLRRVGGIGSELE